MDSSVCVFGQADDNLKDLVELFSLSFVRVVPSVRVVVEGVDQ